MQSYGRVLQNCQAGEKGRFDDYSYLYKGLNLYWHVNTVRFI
jgi:hypothetical protein